MSNGIIQHFDFQKELLTSKIIKTNIFFKGWEINLQKKAGRRTFVFRLLMAIAFGY